MAIDLKLEQLRTFIEAAKKLPKGSRPSYATWWRWWRHGISGVKLETIRVGGKRYTTDEAVARFSVALSARDLDQFPAESSPLRRDRDRRAAEAELRDEGIL